MGTAKTVTRQQFDEMYASLEISMQSLRHEGSDHTIRVRMINTIRNSIAEMHVLSKKFITSRASEILYFREIWPAFYGPLFSEIQAHQCEMARLALSRPGQTKLFRREENRIAAFFRKHREFHLYFKSQSAVLDDLFTREYSRARLFDPLAFVIDPEGSTLASYQAAWCIALEKYKRWLQIELEALRQKSMHRDKIEFVDSKTAAATLIKALALKGSFRINGEKPTATKLKEVFESVVANCSLDNFDNLLYAMDTLKKDPAPFLRELTDGFLAWKDEKRK